jgi:hypothetical protein
MPKLRDRPALEDTEEQIEDTEYADQSHHNLKITDMPSKNGNAKEKGGNYELDECRGQDICQFAKIPVLRAISILPLLCSFLHLIIPSLQS